jgi:two-component system OmpR family response regulator
MGSVRILVVEDEPKMARLLQRGLSEHGHVVEVTGSGEDALWAVSDTEFDLLLLDVTLPGADGFEVCRMLRRRRVWTPVLMLTARGDVADRVEGLDAGADDYLVKPFSLEELLARLRAISRRGPVPRAVLVSVDDLVLDPAARRVWRGRTELSLSAKEFTLLEVFMRRPGQVLSREQLLSRAWDLAYENRSNVVDVYVRQLREKIDRPFDRRSLETVRGVGYRLAPTRST